MKKGLLAAIIVVTGLALAACGSKETGTASSDGWERIDDGTTETAEATGSDFATAVEEDSTEIQVGRLILQVPDSYSVEQDSDGSYTCVYDAGPDKGALIIITAVDASGMSEEDFAGKKDALAQNLADSMADSEDGSMTLVNSQTVEYMGMPGYSYDYDGTITDVPTTMDVDAFLDADGGLVYECTYMEIGEYDRDTATDYGNMMRNAQWANASAETETSRGSDFATPTEESSASSSSDGSGVTPEIKEALDSYEELMNSYCEFMERYQNASSAEALSMLGDYTKMLSQYTDAMSALSEIDQGSLDADDLAYYLDVTNRVTKRLLEVSQ